MRGRQLSIRNFSLQTSYHHSRLSSFLCPRLHQFPFILLVLKKYSEPGDDVLTSFLCLAQSLSSLKCEMFLVSPSDSWSMLVYQAVIHGECSFLDPWNSYHQTRYGYLIAFSIVQRLQYLNSSVLTFKIRGIQQFSMHHATDM